MIHTYTMKIEVKKSYHTYNNYSSVTIPFDQKTMNENEMFLLILNLTIMI